MQTIPTYCRWAKSLGELDGTHQEAWGTEDYNPFRDRDKPTVFFGLYDLRDYLALSAHKGQAWVLWAGSDIQNLYDGFLFNDGKLKNLSKLFQGSNKWALKILEKADHWCENIAEYELLKEMGIEAKIAPSFAGDINKYPLSFKPKEVPEVYVSGHPGRQEEYGFKYVEHIAKRVPECKFHFYGADYKTEVKNVFSHGEVPKEQFNEEIKNYQCGLRTNGFDGFSEITAKSILMGQYPITRIPYRHIASFGSDNELIWLLKSLVNVKEPNKIGREYYLEEINNYPWNVKRNKKA